MAEGESQGDPPPSVTTCHTFNAKAERMFCCQDNPCGSAEALTVTAEATGEWISGLDQGQSSPEAIDGTKLGVIVTFERPDGREKDISFLHRPLGMDCSGQEVVVVERVLRFSQAAKEGVAANWVVRAVNGVRHDVLSTLQAASNQLPQVADIRFTFRVPDAGDKEVEIALRSRPVGITFTRSEPLRVKSVRSQSYAFGLGVARGWVLLRVDGEPIPERLEEAMEMVTFKVANLPDLKASPDLSPAEIMNLPK